MRDEFKDLEGTSHPDPTRRAQIQMKRPLPKRFYKQVSVGREEGGYAILLDGRPVRTPAKNPLTAPTAGLAELMRAEWDAQGEFVDPQSMPVTKLVNTAIDGVALDPQAVFEDILRFSASDLLCYRAEYRRPGGVEWERMWVSSIWRQAGAAWLNVFSQDTPCDSPLRPV